MRKLLILILCLLTSCDNSLENVPNFTFFYESNICLQFQANNQNLGFSVRKNNKWIKEFKLNSEKTIVVIKGYYEINETVYLSKCYPYHFRQIIMGMP